MGGGRGGAEVSVIIPMFAAARVVAPQLAALAAQRDAPPFVVVLADNGRNGDLRESVRAHAAGLEVVVVDATGARGTAFARNLGIEHAPSEKLLFCDADDVVGPTWVRDGARALEIHPVFSGGAVPFTAAELAAPTHEVWALLEQRIPEYVVDAVAMPAGTYPILLGCSFGMTRAFAREIGGFDVTFGSQCEDNDLAFRVQRVHGSLPRAGHVAVAYRIRPADEASMRRALSAGFRHAGLCARHDAWGLSPSFKGRWVARPIKEIVTGRGILGPRADAAGRLAGLIAGRVWFHALAPRVAARRRSQTKR